MNEKKLVAILVASGIGYWLYNKYLAPLPPANIVVGDDQSLSNMSTSGQVAMAGIKKGSMN